jgi:outer membrane protein assembly factor BamB
VRDGVAYVTGCDAVLRGVRISDGHEVSAFPSGGYTGASPALLGVAAFFGTFENEVLGVDLRAGKRLWRYSDAQRPFPFYSSAAVAGGLVVLGGRDKRVHALDAETGRARWTFVTKARVDSSPAVSGGRVYVGSGDGRLYVLDLASGRKLWEFEAGGALSASPAVAGGRLVIGSQDGQLFAFGAK